MASKTILSFSYVFMFVNLSHRLLHYFLACNHRGKRKAKKTRKPVSARRTVNMEKSYISLAHSSTQVDMSILKC